MKKLSAVLLSLAIIAAAASPAFAAAPQSSASGDEFIPVIRFIAASDTHVKESDDTNLNRIDKMLSLGYETARADPNYDSLDAVLIAGDLTNDGTKAEFDRFTAALNGGKSDETAFLGVVAKNHDGYEMKRSEMRGYYNSVTGNDADFHAVINGYHFIGLSASESDVQHYDLKQLSWLDSQLAEATKEDPTKPVFIMHHEHVMGTVYGSSLYDGWGVPYFTGILNKYPQAVDFSGHSHYPLNDPRSLWQGRFTAIGTGAIYYSEFTVEGIRTYHPEDSDATATCWIVEVDAANRIHLRGMDVEAGKQICEYILDNPADPANREYTPAKRRAASKAPVFDDGAAVTVKPTENGCEVTVPLAKSADGMPVVLYRAYAANSLGIREGKGWKMPSYYRATDQSEITLDIGGLAPGEYTVSVVAVNAYGGESEPISAKVTVGGKSGFDFIFYKIGFVFDNIVYFIKEIF